MALVSNSSPLISLARIGKLDLLPKAYPEIIVPSAVRDEIATGHERPGTREILSAPWLRVVAVKQTEAVNRLRFWLDRGESEAIVLARTRNLPLAIDERRGRSIAASLGVETTGTVGLLLAFKRLELVKEVTPLLDDLMARGIRLSSRLYDMARGMAGER